MYTISAGMLDTSMRRVIRDMTPCHVMIGWNSIIQ